MELIAKYTEGMNLREPVFPSLRNPPKKPAATPAVDPAEMAARPIIDAGRIARNG